MEKKIIKNSGISLSNILNHVHFIIYSPFLKLTQKDIYSIYSESKSFSKALENYKISNEKYKIIFEDEDNAHKKNQFL